MAVNGWARLGLLRLFPGRSTTSPILTVRYPKIKFKETRAPSTSMIGRPRPLYAWSYLLRLLTGRRINCPQL